MKQTVKTSRTAGYLEKIFGHLNRDWWNGEKGKDNEYKLLDENIQ